MSLSTPVRLRFLPALLPVNGREIELRVSDEGIIQQRYGPDEPWRDIANRADLKGDIGPKTELRFNGSYIQYRPENGVWSDLVLVDDLVSPYISALQGNLTTAVAGAEAARDIAKDFASDIVSQGNVPIYATIAGMVALEVPAGINAIRVNGRNAAGDNQGGLFVDTYNGNEDTFISGDGRTWYRATDDFSDGAVTDPKVAPATRLSSRIFALVDVKDPPFLAQGDDTTDDTAAFEAWRDFLIMSGRRGLVSEGTFRVANTFDFGNVDVEFAPGASLRHTDGTLWQGGSGGVYVGGASAAPFAGERAFPSRAFRVLSPSVDLVVDSMGSNPEDQDAFSQIKFWKRHYRGVVAGSSYNVAQNLEAFVAYGDGMTGGQKATGSMRVLGQRMQVFSAGNGSEGVTELQAAAHALRFNPNADADNGLNIWVRETTGSGKVGTSAGDWDKYIAGDTVLVQKYTAGRTGTSGNPYLGAFGVVITTVPQAAGFQDASMNDKPSYPLEAMLCLSGWTGSSGAVASGHASGATDGAFIALKIGGAKGGIWTGDVARSRFGRGLFITDTIEGGIFIDGAHPSKSGSFCAIQTTEDSVRSVFGVNNPVSADHVHVGNTGGATSNNLKLYSSKTGTSKRATINYGDRTVMGLDINSDGSNLFGLVDIPSGRIPWFVNASGFFSLLGLPNSANGDRVWRDANGFLKVG